MPFQIKKINPIDLQPSKAVGIKLPFDGKAVFNLNYSTKDAIKTNLTNFFLTGKGERYYNPNFGSEFQRLLFNPIGDNIAGEISRTVRRELSQYFPQVRINDLKVNALPSQNTVQFYLRYEIIDTNIDDTLLINLQNPGFTNLT